MTFCIVLLVDCVKVVISDVRVMTISCSHLFTLLEIWKIIRKAHPTPPPPQFGAFWVIFHEFGVISTYFLSIFCEYFIVFCKKRPKTDGKSSRKHRNYIYVKHTIPMGCYLEQCWWLHAQRQRPTRPRCQEWMQDQTCIHTLYCPLVFFLGCAFHIITVFPWRFCVRFRSFFIKNNEIFAKNGQKIRRNDTKFIKNDPNVPKLWWWCRVCCSYNYVRMITFCMITFTLFFATLLQIWVFGCERIHTNVIIRM